VGVSSRERRLYLRLLTFWSLCLSKGDLCRRFVGYRSAIVAVLSGFADSSLDFFGSPDRGSFEVLFLSRDPPSNLWHQLGVFPRCWMLWLVLPLSRYALRRFCILRSRRPFSWLLLLVNEGVLFMLFQLHQGIFVGKVGVFVWFLRPPFAKNQSDTSGSIEVVLLLLLLSDFSSVVGDILWCPVRALFWYLLKTTSFRKSDHLFLFSRELFLLLLGILSPGG